MFLIATCCSFVVFSIKRPADDDVVLNFAVGAYGDQWLCSGNVSAAMGPCAADVRCDKVCLISVLIQVWKAFRLKTPKFSAISFPLKNILDT